MMKKRKIERENKGDKDDQCEANIKKSGKEWGEGNAGIYVWKMPAAKQIANIVASESCGVDDCEGELEDNSKATINVNDHECKVAEDTKDNIGIIFDLEGNEL
jgi:hypothetical protein